MSVISYDLERAAKQVHELEHAFNELKRVAGWVVRAHQNPKDAPETLQYQIEQLRNELELGK